MVVYCIFFIVFVVAIAFIPVFEAYVALRFFAGAATIAAYVAVFTYGECPGYFNSNMTKYDILFRLIANGINYKITENKRIYLSMLFSIYTPHCKRLIIFVSVLRSRVSNVRPTSIPVFNFFFNRKHSTVTWTNRTKEIFSYDWNGPQIAYI